MAWTVLLTGCRLPPPVRVVPRGEFELHRDLEQCALHGNFASGRTKWVLRLLELEDEFADDPIGTLPLVHDRAAQETSREPLFVLAELAYLAATRSAGDERRDAYLAAAVYAYLYLVGEPDREPPNPYDRRFRWACDIYNRSLVRAIEDEEGGLRLADDERPLPRGSLRMDADLSAFPFETEGLELLQADRLEVVGLDFRIRDSGLGAPLVAVVQRRGEGTAGVGILDETSVSATLFLRVEGGIRDFERGLTADLELHSTYDATDVVVGDVAVPLESDPSATIAYGLQQSNLWRFDFTGFFGGRDAWRQNGLILPRPFERGRIPVVLVHGTASSPAYWAELINSIHADPVIRARFQFWLFIYSTGNPIPYSAASLRESLTEIVGLHDPEGADEALEHMVVVGHSQGGLLTRMTGITCDADDAARALLGEPLDELGLAPEDEQLIRRCFDLEPLPFVDRLVFVATPHRGSFLAKRWFSRMFAKLIAVPGEVDRIARDALSRVPAEKLPNGMSQRVPTSLDNMNPGNPSLEFLSSRPLDPRIRVHSIIPIGDADEPAGADDGVVEYESAHLDDAQSEVLVPSGHSCQAHPRTIIELRRILREHVRELDASGTSAQ